MAQDVTDVISRFFYPTETKDLEKAYGLLLENVKAVDDNTKSITRLEEVRARTDKANLERLAQLDRAIENRKNKIVQETNLIKGQIAANDNLRKSINSNISFLNNMVKTQTTFVNGQGKLVDSTNKAAIAVLNLNRVVQDAPFGLLGIANNIDPLVQSFQSLVTSTGSAKGAFQSMLGTLAGPQGLFLAISLISSLLITFGDELIDLAFDADKTEKEIDDLTKSIEGLVDAQVKYNRTIEENVDGGINEQKRRIAELKAGNADRNKILAEENKLTELENGSIQRQLKLLNDLESAIINSDRTNFADNIGIASFELQDALKKAYSDGFNLSEIVDKIIVPRQEALREKLKDVQSKDRIEQAKFDQDTIRINKEIAEKRQAEREKKYKDDLENIDQEALITKENDKLLQIKRSELDTELQIFRDRKQLRADEGTQLTAGALKIEQEELDTNVKTIEYQIKALESGIDIVALNRKALLAEQQGLLKEAAEFRAASRKIDVERQKTLAPQDFIPFTNLDGEIPKNRKTEPVSLKRNKTELEIDTDLFKKKEALRKRDRESIIKSEQLLQQALLQIAQNTADRQVQLLDYEIQVRTQRVQQATLLAQNGNAEILKSEQERLDAAQKKREDIAQRQLQINQLLQASSAAIAAAQALQTVTNAGATGDPYSAAARIAAAVAALAAGFAFVSNLVNTFQGFREGVIDYNGKGNETSDSNLVRISHGESVMTASETKTYRGALTAMREGNFYNQYLPAQYTYKGNNHSESHDLRREFGMLREAFENSGIKVRTAVTNGQISTIVEKERKVDQRRFGG